MSSVFLGLCLKMFRCSADINFKVQMKLVPYCRMYASIVVRVFDSIVSPVVIFFRFSSKSAGFFFIAGEEVGIEWNR